MDIFDYIKYLGAIASIFIVHQLFFTNERRFKKKSSHYSKPAWNFYLKRIYVKFILRRKYRANKNRKIERELQNEEATKILLHEESYDDQMIFGYDAEGNFLVLKYERRRHRVAELWLMLQLKTGEFFTFPSHPNSTVVNATPKAFEGAGLKLECLEPHSKWRITYSGWMRKTPNSGENDEDLHFVKMNFFWSAASNPLFRYDLNENLISTALAREKWRDGKWLSLIKTKGSGYDQAGSCYGELRIFDSNVESYIEGIPPCIKLELNLPGIRKRQWGVDRLFNLHRIAFITASTADGCVFEVGATSANFGLTHLQYGNVFLPLGISKKIDYTDFNLEALANDPDHLPEATIVNITAGKMKFLVVVVFKNLQKIQLQGENKNGKWKAFIIPIEIKWNNEVGQGTAVFWYPQKNKKEFSKREIPIEIKRDFLKNEKLTGEELVLSFMDKEAQMISNSGGKGSSLAILKEIQDTKGANFFDHRNRSIQILNTLVDQASNVQENNLRSILKIHNSVKPRERSASSAKVIFPDPNDFEIPEFEVPEGFIVSVAAFNSHLENNPEIVEAIQNLENVAYKKVDGNLQEQCQNVREVFKKSKISEKLKENLISEMQKLCKEKSNVRFAVRSSGVTEDGEETSTAGQNDTFLGLRTQEEVLSAVVSCWSSLFTTTSVSYRIQHIQPVITQMSVVVQVMVDATAAGVLFTKHPLTGDPRVIVITANYGLGESVVSGKSDPDTFYVKRNHKDKVQYLGTKIGMKKIVIRMSNGNATEEIENQEKSEKVCLSEEIVEKLAILGIIMEKFFGTPRDIEFAVVDEKIYLLQSRPITSLNNFSDFEILHERDSAIMGNLDVCTKANVGEVILGSSPAFGQSSFTELIERSMVKLVNAPENYRYFKSFFPIHSQHLFISVGATFLVSLKDKPKIQDEISAMALFGHNIYEDFPQLVDIAQKLSFYRSPMSLFRLRDSIFFKLSNFDRNAELMERMKVQFSMENLKKLTNSSDVLDLFIRGENEYFYPILEVHMKASNFSSIFQIFTFSILAQKSEKLTTQHKNDIATILGCAKNVESATIPMMIKKISKAIMKSGKSEEFLSIQGVDSQEWLENNCHEAFKLFKDFVEKHGHRGINELEISSVPWGEEPYKIIEMIKSNLNINKKFKDESDEDVIVPELTIQELFAKIKTPLAPFTKILLRYFLPRCIRGVEYRERAKSYLVASCNELRRSVRYMGRLMVNEGLLPDPELIFHLTIHEIKEIIHKREDKAIPRAIRRKKFHPKWNELKFPEISFGIPKPEEMVNKNQFKAGDVLVKGTPVCSGYVVARACVCKSFADVSKIKEGDILVTYGTDVGWSPFFPILSAVVTEIGGLISHGAVVAREYGLPCIVAATNATDLIQDGQKIILNADEGIIIKSEE